MSRSPSTDRRYLVEEQYADDRNLRARWSIYRFATNTGWERWLFDRFALAPGERVLDAGCGPAAVWQRNADRLDPTLSLTLVDLSPGMVDRAREQLGSRAAQYAVMDVQDLTFADSSFDVVLANHMLYHVPDRPRALGHLTRVLRPGGRFFATTIGERHMEELRDVVGFDVRSGNHVRFGLENGAVQLAEHFDDVSLELFPGHLEVTEPEAVVDYVLSTRNGRNLSPAGVDLVRRRTRAAIERDGHFRLTQASGLFSATRS